MIYRPRNRVFAPISPAGRVVPVEEMKEHLRVVEPDEDALVASIEAAAVARAERWMQRLLYQREVLLRLPGVPSALNPVELPGGPVDRVLSVIIGGVTISGCTAVGDSPALLLPTSLWPSIGAEGYPMEVGYIAGYKDVPADLIAAVKLIAGHLYENRQAVVMDATSATVPLGAEWLMADYRIKAI